MGMINSTRIDGTRNTVQRAENSYITGQENLIEMLNGILAGAANVNSRRRPACCPSPLREVPCRTSQRFQRPRRAAPDPVRICCPCPRMIIGEYNEPISGVVYTTSLAFEIGCGTSEYSRKRFRRLLLPICCQCLFQLPYCSKHYLHNLPQSSFCGCTPTFRSLFQTPGEFLYYRSGKLN